MSRSIRSYPSYLLKWTALFLLLSLLVSACAAPAAAPAGGGGEEEAAAAQPEEESVVLRVSNVTGPVTAQVMEMLINGFKESHPNVEIKQEVQTGDYAENMYAMAAAGNLPDIMFTADIFTAPFVDAGLLLDMQPLAEVDDEFDLNDVYESILALGRIEGDPGLYMIPASLDTVQMYYNKTLWESAGAPLPQADWTWDDLISACQIVQEAHEDVKCMAFGTTEDSFDWWAYWVPWVRGYGGDVLSADGTQSTLSSPESLAGLQAYADLWVKHQVAVPLGSELGGDCFVNQRCAVFFHIPGLIRNLRESVAGNFEWDVQFTPSHPEGHYTGMGTFGFAISSSTEHPELAWDFVKFLASKEGQRTITENYMGMPLLKSMADDPVFDRLEPPPANLEPFIHGGDIGIFPRTYPVECGSLYSGQVNSTIRAALEEVIRGVSTAAEVFPGVDAEIQDCLDSANQG